MCPLVFYRCLLLFPICVPACVLSLLTLCPLGVPACVLSLLLVLLCPMYVPACEREPPSVAIPLDQGGFDPQFTPRKLIYPGLKPGFNLANPMKTGFGRFQPDVRGSQHKLDRVSWEFDHVLTRTGANHMRAEPRIPQEKYLSASDS